MPNPQPTPVQLTLVAVAITLPTLAALAYFVALDGHPAAPHAYLAAKAIQFALPLLPVGLWATIRRRRTRSCAGEARTGTVAGLAAAALVAIAFLVLRDGPLAGALGTEVAAKTRGMGIDTPIAYLTLALALSLGHSLLEEYYWRGFVLGCLARWISESRALGIAALAFASHHVVIVTCFALPASAPAAAVVASIAVAGAGWVWGRLYLRGGSLLAPWIAHAIADLAVMAAGYALIRGQ